MTTGRDLSNPIGLREEIEAQAADFLQRRRFSRWTSADDAQLEAWLDEATAHRVAFLRLETRAVRIERLADLRPPRLNPKVSASRIRFKLPLLVAFASVALVAVVGIAVEQLYQQPADRIYSTEVGGQAILKFADRTQIALDTDSVVRVRMTSDQRTVWLEKGEAYFRVAHDAAHPFSVIVGNHRVTDLGTEFLVRRIATGL